MALWISSFKAKVFPVSVLDVRLAQFVLSSSSFGQVDSLVAGVASYTALKVCALSPPASNNMTRSFLPGYTRTVGSEYFCCRPIPLALSRSGKAAGGWVSLLPPVVVVLWLTLPSPISVCSLLYVSQISRSLLSLLLSPPPCWSERLQFDNTVGFVAERFPQLRVPQLLYATMVGLLRPPLQKS